MSRSAMRLPLLVFAVFLGSAGRTTRAEEFRVFTVVYDLSAAQQPGMKLPVVARAATLFHSGKVYDYVDAANEVIVLEPTQRRFRVLNAKRGLVATVAFDEIRQLLNVAREETQREAESLGSGDPGGSRTAALLAFQLNPRFDETVQKDGVLKLAGGPLDYSVQPADPKRPGVAAEYLDYADMVCQLNYLLHPGPVLPGPRLALNRSLRERNVLPASVELSSSAMPSLHLRAEHAIYFDLNTQEKNWIFQWESQLKSPSTREVPLGEYQKTVLTARAH